MRYGSGEYFFATNNNDARQIQEEFCTRTTQRNIKQINNDRAKNTKEYINDNPNKLSNGKRTRILQILTNRAKRNLLGK